MSNQTKCCLCSQIIGDRNNDLISILLEEEKYTRRVPLETEHFAVIPSLGPIVQGHSLICPKEHIKSFASLHSSLKNEYIDFKRKIIGILSLAYNLPIHCFEHGASKSSSKVICTVDHAHLHLIPNENGILDLILSTFNWIPIDSTSIDLEKIVGDNEYIYYETPTGTAFIALAKERPFESQYMRKIFYSVSNQQHNWNWRKAPLPLQAHQTYETISNAAGFL